MRVDQLMREKREKRDKQWPKLVALYIDAKGVMVDFRCGVTDETEKNKLYGDAERWWLQTLARAKREPETVHPILHELLNTKKEFVWVLDMGNAPL